MGGGGLTKDSKWGGWKHLFLSNSLKFPKKWGRGVSPPPPPAPCLPRALNVWDQTACHKFKQINMNDPSYLLELYWQNCLVCMCWSSHLEAIHVQLGNFYKITFSAIPKASASFLKSQTATVILYTANEWNNKWRVTRARGWFICKCHVLQISISDWPRHGQRPHYILPFLFFILSLKVWYDVIIKLGRAVRLWNGPSSGE